MIPSPVCHRFFFRLLLKIAGRVVIVATNTSYEQGKYNAWQARSKLLCIV
jgi:hypothetical protein